MMRGGIRGRGAAGGRPQSVKNTVARLMRYVGAYRLRLVFVVLCIVLNAAADGRRA